MPISVRTFPTLTLVNYPTIQSQILKSVTKIRSADEDPNLENPDYKHVCFLFNDEACYMNANCDMTYQICTGNSDAEFSLQVNCNKHAASGKI